MRVLGWLLLAALLAIVGAYPQLALLIGSLLLAVLGLTLHGAVLLLAQTAVQICLGATVAVWLYRNRRTA